MPPEETIDVEADVIAPEETSEETASEEKAATKEEEDGPKSLDDLEPTSDEDAADEDGGDEDEGEADAEDEPEMRVFDFGGNKLEVPADAVPQELADKIEEFTKGTWSKFTTDQQANVERSKALDTREEAVAKITSLNGDALKTYTHGLQLRSDIEQLSAVDLSQLWQSDPDRARQISDVIAGKQAEFQKTVALVGQQENQIDAAQKEEIARRTEEGKAVLDKRFKNFSAEKAPELVKYVVENYGMSQEEAETWPLTPKVTEMAYKAMLYDRQSKAAKKQPKQPGQTKPVKEMKTKGASTGGSRDPDKMSMSQLAKHLDLHTG